MDLQKKKIGSNQDHTYISILCFRFNCYVSRSNVYLLHIVCKPSYIAMHNQSCLMQIRLFSCEVFHHGGCN